MVGRQRESYGDQSHVPVADRDEETLGAQILKACIAYETLVRTGESHVRAVATLRNRPDEYDPILVAALSELPIEVLPYEQQTVDITNLVCRMVLDEDLRTKEGTLLVAKGAEMTETLRTRIQNCGTEFLCFRVLTHVEGSRVASTS